TDPAMVKCFVSWIEMLGISTDKLKLKLHIYSDQDERKIKTYWSHHTGIPLDNFYKTYIKATESSRKSYKGMHEKGTCSVIYHNRDMYEYVLAGVKYLRDKHGLPPAN